MAAVETCSVCGAEVRWGHRDGLDGQGVRLAYWHRELVDHEPIFGRRMTAEDVAEVARQKALPRTRVVSRKVKGSTEKVDVEETYTVDQLEREALLKTAKGRERVAIEEGDDDEEPESPLEPIEVYAFDIPLKGDFRAPRVDGGWQNGKVPGGCRTVLNLADKQGWTVVRLTYSRGPYLGSKGGSLGVSDFVRLILRGPVLDEGPLFGVASWRDGKSDWTWIHANGHTDNATVTQLKNLMKEVPSGQDPRND